MLIGPSSRRHGLDQRPDGIGIGEVGLHRDGLAAGGLDLGDHLVRAGLAAGVVDCDGSAARCELAGDGRANALGCAGNQRDFSLKSCS